MNILIRKIDEKKTFLKNADFAYIKPTEDLDATFFLSEDDLDRFANSTEENQEQIILKKFNNKRFFYISMNDYDAILVDEGNKIYLSSFWVKQECQEIKNIKPDFKKAKKEIAEFFSNTEKKKLAS